VSSLFLVFPLLTRFFSHLCVRTVKYQLHRCCVTTFRPTDGFGTVHGRDGRNEWSYRYVGVVAVAPNPKKSKPDTKTQGGCVGAQRAANIENVRREKIAATTNNECTKIQHSAYNATKNVPRNTNAYPFISFLSSSSSCSLHLLQQDHHPRCRGQECSARMGYE